MFARQAWYSAGWSHELDRTPLTRRILGREVVLFRDADGRARAIDATCPHRGANLGRGRIVEGSIECPFHGWRFDGDGRCTRIPSQPCSMKIPKGARVDSYPLVESQSILWIWTAPEVSPDHKPPHYDFFEDDRFHRVMDRAFYGAAPYVSVVENAIDNSHPAFIHRYSLPGEAQIVERQRIRFDADGRGYLGTFDADSPWRAEPPTRVWSDRLRPFQRLAERDVENSYFRFDMGSVVYFYDAFRGGHAHVGFAAITPADDTHTWFFGEMARTYWRSHIVDFFLKPWMHWLNKEDVDECAELLSSRRPGGLARPISVEADRPSLAFRQVYTRCVEAEQRSDGGERAAASA